MNDPSRHRRVTWSLVLAAVLTVVFVGPAQAGLIEAHQEALALWKKTKDPDLALAVLEGAGVKDVLKQRPVEMKVTAYVRLLNDYGFFLSKDHERYWDAETVLKRVLSVDAERTVAYLNIGDLYYHSRLKSTIQGKQITFSTNRKHYRHYYKEYADRLYNKGIHILLPWHVQSVLMVLHHPYVSDDEIQLTAFLYDYGYYENRLASNLVKAKSNNVDAQIGVARHFFYGLGRRHNYHRALEWYKTAAEHNSSTAAYMIGVIYLNGYGVEKNLRRASKWFEIAESRGYSEARLRLKEIDYIGKMTKAPECKSVRSIFDDGQEYEALGVLRTQGCVDHGPEDKSRSGKFYHWEHYTLASIREDLLRTFLRNNNMKSYLEALSLFANDEERAHNATGFSSYMHRLDGSQIEIFLPTFIRLNARQNRRYSIAIHYAILGSHYSDYDKTQAIKFFANAKRLAEMLDEPRDTAKAMAAIRTWMK